MEEKGQKQQRNLIKSRLVGYSKEFSLGEREQNKL